MKPLFRLVFLMSIVILHSEQAKSKQDVQAFILPEIDIGIVGLPQKAIAKELADGVTYFDIDRGVSSEFDNYKLVSQPLSILKAREMKTKLAEHGQNARIEPLSEFGLYGKPLGVQVVIAPFQDSETPKELSVQLSALGFGLTLRHSSEEGCPTTGPFKISLLKIDLTKFNGRIESALSHDSALGVERTSSIVRRHKALAAINGGFFSWSENVGTTGDLAGISVVNGSLVSEAVDGRPALLIRSDVETRKLKSVEIVQDLKTRIWLTIGGKRFDVGGLNRKPGMILNCGNNHAVPTVIPVHDYVCSNDDEVVLFNDHFVHQVPKNQLGLQFRINSDGYIQDKGEEVIGLVPNDGYLVQAIGAAAEQLGKAVQAGDPVTIHIEVFSGDQEIEIEKGLYIVNGGPTLLNDGFFDLSARGREGWETNFGAVKISDKFVDENDAVASQSAETNLREGFYHSWVVRRHPRTAVGLTEDNVLYFVVVYGRQPGVSAGASLSDMTRLMRSLGVVDAINLDGGGSAVMVVDGEPSGVPSDALGERFVGDAILVFDAKPEVSE